MSKLPSIEELYPNVTSVKHNGDAPGLTLKIVKWIEAKGFFITKDFYVDMQEDPERVFVYFRKKKPAKLFKQNKKLIRDGESEAADAE